MSGFMQCLRWNLGHCACQASTLPTEPHPQPTTSVFFFFLSTNIYLSAISRKVGSLKYVGLWSIQRKLPTSGLIMDPGKTAKRTAGFFVLFCSLPLTLCDLLTAVSILDAITCVTQMSPNGSCCECSQQDGLRQSSSACRSTGSLLRCQEPPGDSCSVKSAFQGPDSGMNLSDPDVKHTQTNNNSNHKKHSWV